MNLNSFVPCDCCKAAFDELMKLVYIDHLTGVANRRAFDEALARELAKFERTETAAFCVAILDLDHFKAVNDTYGHAVGDAVLKALGNLLREKNRASDFIGRIGGEEFGIILPDTSVKKALLYLKRLRKAIEEELVVRVEEKHVATINVTASLGVTEVAPGETSDTLLKRADKALYSAKTSGRNKVVHLHFSS